MNSGARGGKRSFFFRMDAAETGFLRRPQNPSRCLRPTRKIMIIVFMKRKENCTTDEIKGEKLLLIERP